MLTCEQSPKKTTRTRWRRVARSAGHERGVFPSEAVTRNAWSIRAKSERRAKPRIIEGSLELGGTCRRSLVLARKCIARIGSRVTARSRALDFAVVHASLPECDAIHRSDNFQPPKSAHSRVLKRNPWSSRATQRRRNFSLAKVGVEGSNPFARSSFQVLRSRGIPRFFRFSGRLKSQSASEASETRVTCG